MPNSYIISLIWAFFSFPVQGSWLIPWGSGSGEPKEPSSPLPPSYITGALINTAFRWTADPETERKKFPEINVVNLLGMIHAGDPTGDLIKLKDRTIEYKIESEGTLLYDGIATIDQHVVFGKVIHTFLGPGKGFDPAVVYKSYDQGLGSLLTRWIQTGCNENFKKGIPYKGEDSKTRLDYMGYNNETNEYISLVVRRRKR